VYGVKKEPGDGSIKKASCLSGSLAREHITGEEGIVPRVNRSIQEEGAFGVTKEDSRFRRFMTRGKAGVRGELFPLCFGYNVNKPHHKIQQGRCGKSPHRLKEKAS
jgi:hypothetical protein